MRLAILGGFVDSVNKRAESREPRAEKEAVEASLAGDVRKAFEKLGSSVAEVKADNIAGAVAARWLKLSVVRRAILTPQYRATSIAYRADRRATHVPNNT